MLIYSKTTQGGTITYPKKEFAYRFNYLYRHASN